MDWSKIVETLTPLLTPLVLALTTCLYALAARYALDVLGMALEKVLKVVDWARGKLNARWLSRIEADDFLWEHIEKAVRFTHEHLVADIKAASADGKLTTDEATEAMEAAWKAFSSTVTEVDMEELKDVLKADVKKLVWDRIPVALANLKLDGFLPLIGSPVQLNPQGEDTTSDPTVP
jgi:hypothetical protein